MLLAAFITLLRAWHMIGAALPALVCGSLDVILVSSRAETVARVVDVVPMLPINAPICTSILQD